MMKALDNLRWSPKWVTHLGCIKGCLDYLGLELSDAWLYGGTGHAFVLNIAQDLCPSGPTAWRTMMLFELGRNLGYEFDSVFGWKQEQDLADLQRRAWEFTRQQIDEGLPVYGWELEYPEFYVIYGYDEVGYYYSGVAAEEGKGPKPWQELGDTPIGLVEIYCLKPGRAQDAAVVVRSALEKALRHASNPKEWILDGYSSGLKGFDAWTTALESGKANRLGLGYNAAVWAECRQYAVGFLREAKDRLNGRASALFDEALDHYQVVATRLSQVSEIYPHDPGARDTTVQADENRQAAVGSLREARDAEAAGLEALRRIAAEL
jgi:hypothetical protein